VDALHPGTTTVLRASDTFSQAAVHPNAAHVLGVGDRLKMTGIHAGDDSTEVIKVKVGRDRPNEELVNVPVSQHPRPAMGGTELAVPVLVARAKPSPTVKSTVLPSMSVYDVEVANVRRWVKSSSMRCGTKCGSEVKVVMTS